MSLCNMDDNSKVKDKDLPNYSITYCQDKLQYLKLILAQQILIQHYSSYAFDWYTVWPR